MLLCSNAKEDLLQGIISVPVACVPKTNPDRTVSDKVRLIWDATVPNEDCPKEDHPPAFQPRHADLARVILFWKMRFPRLRVLLSKKDIRAAFKLLWLALQDMFIFAADFPGEQFGAEGLITALYVCLTFGWSGSPGEWTPWAWDIL